MKDVGSPTRVQGFALSRVDPGAILVLSPGAILVLSLWAARRGSAPVARVEAGRFGD